MHIQNPFIEFKKQRDFGLLLSDTFNFIRNEFKPLFKAIFSIAGPVLLVFLLSMWFYTYTVGDAFNIDFYTGNSPLLSNPFLIIISVLAYLISAILAYAFSISTVLHYIKSYVSNNGTVDISEVKTNVYKTFWGYLGLGLLKWITLIFSALLCGLPILYTMVPMFVVYCIYTFENHRGVTESYSYSFNLINEDFWQTFGLIILLGILLYIVSLVFAIPSLIYTYAKMGIFSGKIDPENIGSLVDPVYILLSILNTLVQFLLNLILVVASAFTYFHLNEKKNYTGTYERISNIGKLDD